SAGVGTGVAVAGAGVAAGALPATGMGAGWADVAVDVGGDRLVGTITGLQGSVLRDVAYSAVRPARRLGAWAKLLALSAARPDVAWTAVTLGQSRGQVEVATIDALGPDPATRRATAMQYLTLLVDLYRRGMCCPLPLYTATSAAYAAAVVAGKDGALAAGREWTTTPEWTREDQDADHKLVLGGVAGIDDVLAERALADEDGDGWDPSHGRFGRYALRLWTGLLAHEQVRHG
ncbi:MAG TPA: hypothetical protein VKV06_16765, partial [Acidimicrobiales bacterium]|nr:hypothetical protein [Acidimicrobiales bacterium]